MDIINKFRLTEAQYINETSTKKQIYLHHTAGSKSGEGVIHWWESNKERIGTAYVIDYDGDIYECFPDEKWAYHLGIKKAAFDTHKLKYLNLDKTSIGIELCSWGPLTFKNNKYYNYVGGEIKAEEVIKLDKSFKKHLYFHKYSNNQIASTKYLLKKLGSDFKIPLSYSSKIWDINTNALKGVPGVYTHVSVRTDKSDCYPDTGLIKMLESL